MLQDDIVAEKRASQTQHRTPTTIREQVYAAGRRDVHDLRSDRPSMQYSRSFKLDCVKIDAILQGTTLKTVNSGKEKLVAFLRLYLLFAHHSSHNLSLL